MRYLETLGQLHISDVEAILKLAGPVDVRPGKKGLEALARRRSRVIKDTVRALTITNTKLPSFLVCMSVCMYVCMYIYICAHLSISMFTYLSSSLSIQISISRSTCPWL